MGVLATSVPAVEVRGALSMPRRYLRVCTLFDPKMNLALRAPHFPKVGSLYSNGKKLQPKLRPGNSFLYSSKSTTRHGTILLKVMKGRNSPANLEHDGFGTRATVVAAIAGGFPTANADTEKPAEFQPLSVCPRYWLTSGI